jgi:hypothetical protein
MEYELGASIVPPMPSAAASLFNVDISEAFGVDFVPMANDIVRMLCIQIAIQIMMVLSGAPGTSFLTADFLLLVFYTALGLTLYWLAVRKIVVFV